MATLPGHAGAGVAFAAELLISAFLMFMVLALGRSPRLSPYTGVFVGGLLFLYILVEAPLSGMSMKPARTLASALTGGVFDERASLRTGVLHHDPDQTGQQSL